MSIYIVTGYPGAGKTTFAVAQAVKFARHYKRPVFTNFPIYAGDLDIGYFDNWEDLKELSNAVVVLDEAPRWFSSRAWQSTKVDDLQVFAQHRKDGITLFLIAQEFGQLDAQVRDLAIFVWRIKRMFGPDENEDATKLERYVGIWAKATKFEAAGYLTATKAVVHRRLFFRLDRWFGLFDTFHRVGSKFGEGVGRGRAQTTVTLPGHGRRPGLGVAPGPIVGAFSPDEYSRGRVELFGGSLVRWRRTSPFDLVEGGESVA